MTTQFNTFTKVIVKLTQIKFLTNRNNPNRSSSVDIAPIRTSINEDD